ncbi:MAG: response regulator [Acidobacteriales bacterium]|nr:response regulator [Terriglobales bacterium]
MQESAYVRRPYSVFAALSLAVVMAHALSNAHVGDTALGSLLSDLAQLASSAIAAITFYVAAARNGPPAKRFLSLIAHSFAIWSVIQALWIYLQHSGTDASPILSLAHLLFFFAFTPMFLATFETENRPKGIDWLYALDLLQVGIVIGTTYFFLFSIPTIWPNRQMAAEAFFQAMNIRNLLLVAAFYLRSRSSRSLVLRSLFREMFAVLMFYAVANGIAGYALIYRHTTLNSWLELAWSAPFALAVLQIGRWRSPADADASPAHVPEDSMTARLAVNLLPITVPLLVIVMASRIAMTDLRGAGIFVTSTFLIYGLRTFVIQARQAAANHRLRRSEDRFHLLFAQHPHPMFVYQTHSLRILEVNQAAIQKYGYSREEFLEMTVQDIRPEEDLPRFIELISARSPNAYLGQWRHKTRDGKILHVDITARTLHFEGHEATLVTATDITERRVLEEQLRQSQKMEAVGTLAGGVAHDFNNLLTVIKGYGTLLQEQLDGSEKGRNELGEILQAADRASSLTRQLLAFSRRQILRTESVDLNTLVLNSVRMLERLIGENIRVTTRLSPDIGLIQADTSQIDQVILNLAVNARDAMPAGGELIFETSCIAARDISHLEHLSLAADHYVLLRVTDTGTGMDPATKAHIFEPFFTTKEQGKGTGLGLSTVYGIVKQSDGFIWVVSAPDKGTSFFIYLPRVEKGPEGMVRFDAPARWGRSVQQTILLVEDESSLRHLARTVLAAKGFRVIEAADGAQARGASARHIGSIDLMITDIVMPGMNGHDLASALSHSRPNMRVLYMTGYTEATAVGNGVNHEEFDLLQKPFSPATLLRKVYEMLDRQMLSTDR